MMKENIKSTILTQKIMMVLIFLVVLPMALFAKGGRESAYDQELNKLTQRICTAVEAKEMNAVEAKSLLDELRTKYRKEYTDESGKMDSIIDELAGGDITAEQAGNQFRILEQARIQERTKEELRQKEQIQLREQERIQTQSRDRSQDQTQDQTRDQTRDQTKSKSPDKSGSGSGSGK